SRVTFGASKDTTVCCWVRTTSTSGHGRHCGNRNREPATKEKGPFGPSLLQVYGCPLLGSFLHGLLGLAHGFLHGIHGCAARAVDRISSFLDLFLDLVHGFGRGLLGGIHGACVFLHIAPACHEKGCGGGQHCELPDHPCCCLVKVVANVGGDIL